MGWNTVDHMFGPAPVCTGCGQAPRNQDSADNELLPAYNADGVDVDWGNHLFICYNCADVIAELHGCLTRPATDALKSRIRLREGQLERANTKLEEQQAKIDRILGGAKARKELKESAETTAEEAQ